MYAELPREMIKDKICEKEHKIYRFYKLCLISFITVLSVAELIGVKPSKCSTQTGYITIMVVLIITAIIAIQIFL